MSKRNWRCSQIQNLNHRTFNALLQFRALRLSWYLNISTEALLSLTPYIQELLKILKLKLEFLLWKKVLSVLWGKKETCSLYLYVCARLKNKGAQSKYWLSNFYIFCFYIIYCVHLCLNRYLNLQYFQFSKQNIKK